MGCRIRSGHSGRHTGAESQVRYSRSQRDHGLCGRHALRRVLRCVGRSGGRSSDQSCLRGHSQVQRDAFCKRAGLVHRRGFVVGSDHRKAGVFPDPVGGCVRCTYVPSGLRRVPVGESGYKTDVHRRRSRGAGFERGCSGRRCLSRRRFSNPG